MIDKSVKTDVSKSTRFLKEALEEVVKSDVNKRKIIISATEEKDGDPERKKPHLSPKESEEHKEVTLVCL